MDIKWTKGYEDKDKRRSEVLSYKQAFDDLKELLKDWEEVGAPDYKSPSWSHEQADRNGANRMLNRIIQLIDIQKG